MRARSGASASLCFAATLLALPTLGCTQADIVPRSSLDGGADGAVAPPDAAATLDAGSLPDGACPIETVDTAGTPEGCTLKLPPGRPLCGSDDRDVGELTFAVNDVVLSTTTSDGIDFDRHCTTSPDAPSGCESPAGVAALIDGEGGADNAWAVLRGLLATFYQFRYGRRLDDDVDAFADRGQNTAMIRVRGWNGEPFDQNVEVTFALSVCGYPPETPSTCAPPLSQEPLDWTRTDLVLHPDTRGFRDGDLEQPTVLDLTAYVADGRLVARLPDGDTLRIQTDVGEVSIGLRDTQLLADLAPDGSSLSAGVLAGKWPRRDIEEAARGFGICPGESEYATYRTNIESVLDSTADGLGGPGVTCDAMSAVLGFSARRVVWGDPVAGIVRPDPCL